MVVFLSNIDIFIHIYGQFKVWYIYLEREKVGFIYLSIL